LATIVASGDRTLAYMHALYTVARASQGCPEYTEGRKGRKGERMKQWEGEIRVLAFCGVVGKRYRKEKRGIGKENGR